MILERFPTLQQLDSNEKVQLATELCERALDEAVVLPPELLAAIEGRIAYNSAHPEEVFLADEVTERLAALRGRIAARKAHA